MSLSGCNHPQKNHFRYRNRTFAFLECAKESTTRLTMIFMCVFYLNKTNHELAFGSSCQYWSKNSKYGRSSTSCGLYSRSCCCWSDLCWCTKGGLIMPGIGFGNGLGSGGGKHCCTAEWMGSEKTGLSSWLPLSGSSKSNGGWSGIVGSGVEKEANSICCCFWPILSDCGMPTDGKCIYN